MVFADATKDPTAKQAYKQIVGINEAFKKLTEGVTETGQAKNAVLDLEAKVRMRVLRLLVLWPAHVLVDVLCELRAHLSVQMEQISERTNTLNAGRLLEDLKQIKKENAQLAAQLKAKT